MPPSTVSRRVLFIEDERELRDAYRRYFETRYEMAFAATGADALPQLESFQPEVIVLDMRLPDTDGIDLLRRIRERHPGVAVVVTTAYSSMEPIIEVLGLDHSGYLLKPYSLNELAERIDAAG